MKQSFATAVLILTVSLAAFGQTTDKKPRQDEKVEQDLLQLDRQWAEIAVQGDMATFDRIFSDDYTSTHSNGRVVTKAEERAYVVSAISGSKFLSISTDDVKVRVYGDTAVIIGRVTVKPRSGSERHSRYTTVWVKRKNRWQLVAEQFASIPAQQSLPSPSPLPVTPETAPTPIPTPSPYLNASLE